MGCLDPPLDETPPGAWFCPTCNSYGHIAPPPLPDPLLAESSVRGQSVASSSQVQSIGDEDINVDDDDTVQTFNTPTKKARKRKPSRKGKEPMEDETEMLPASSSRKVKRQKSQASAPNTATRPRIKLKIISNKRKTREWEPDEEEEDGEEPQAGLFDNILDEEQRSTSDFAITAADKHRFEAARRLAEVGLLPCVCSLGLTNRP
jgi:hypothetical protein